MTNPSEIRNHLTRFVSIFWYFTHLDGGPEMNRRRSLPAALLSSVVLVLSGSFSDARPVSGTSAADLKRAPRPFDAASSAAGVRTFVLYDGSTARIGADGFGSVTSPGGAVRPIVLPRSGGRSAVGEAWGPSDREILRLLSLPLRGATSPNELIVVLSGAGEATAVATAPSSVPAAPALTGDAAIDAALRSA